MTMKVMMIVSSYTHGGAKNSPVVGRFIPKGAEYFTLCSGTFEGGATFNDDSVSNLPPSLALKEV